MASSGGGGAGNASFYHSLSSQPLLLPSIQDSPSLFTSPVPMADSGYLSHLHQSNPVENESQSILSPGFYPQIVPNVGTTSGGGSIRDNRESQRPLPSYAASNSLAARGSRRRIPFSGNTGAAVAGGGRGGGDPFSSSSSALTSSGGLSGGPTGNLRLKTRQLEAQNRDLKDFVRLINDRLDQIERHHLECPWDNEVKAKFEGLEIKLDGIERKQSRQQEQQEQQQQVGAAGTAEMRDIKEEMERMKSSQLRILECLEEIKVTLQRPPLPPIQVANDNEAKKLNALPDLPCSPILLHSTLIAEGEDLSVTRLEMAPPPQVMKRWPMIPPPRPRNRRPILNGSAVSSSSRKVRKLIDSSPSKSSEVGAFDIFDYTDSD